MATDDDMFLAYGPAYAGFSGLVVGDNGGPVYDYCLAGFGVIAGAYGRAGSPGGPENNNVFLGAAGVVGTSRDQHGAAGTSVNNIGVYGQTEQLGSVPSLVGGVYGTGNVRPGVIGWSSQGTGVQGTAFVGAGVRGTSFRSPGMQGQSTLSSGVTGVSGTSGPPAGMGIPTTAGVVGTADARPGLIGTSRALMGIYGFSTGNAGVVGQTANPNSFAGFFAGNVAVTGTLTAGVKNAAVPFPDGTQRLLHCMESPEHWFEDFGSAKLRNGRAVVKLDADFAKVIKRGDYHVFLTPRGDCGGLYLRRQGGTGFEVREQQGGTSSVAFSYRIVGRRRDIKAHQRFARIDARLPGLAEARAAARKRAPTGAERRKFIAGLEQEMGQRGPKAPKKAARLRAPPPRITRAPSRA
jgi:hypothetical protein